MRLKTAQIVWHERQPVLSLDFHSAGCLATAGSDKTIKLWKVADLSSGSRGVEFLGDLTGHMSSVNCVRFSPCGGYLASGGDCGELVLWKNNNDAKEGNQEKLWSRSGVLRGHSEDIHDLSWCQDSSALISGAVEGTVIVWDVATKRGKVRLANHKNYVQGVAWDPANEYIVTQGADRTCRVYSCATFERTVASKPARSDASNQWLLERTIFKQRLKGSSGVETNECLFHDDTLPSFFRRLDWSPDGSFLVVPSGIYKISGSNIAENCAFIFARGKWSAPAMQLAGLSEPFVCVRFCPILFHLPSEGNKENEGHDSNPDAGFGLPYRVVFAVATITSVVLYASEDPVPLAVLGGLHCAAITDLAWSNDGTLLAMSSRDGYCSFVRFDDGELGRPLHRDSMTPAASAWLEHLDRLKTWNYQESKGTSSNIPGGTPTEPLASSVQNPDQQTHPKGKKRIAPVADKEQDPPPPPPQGSCHNTPICLDLEENTSDGKTAEAVSRSKATGLIDERLAARPLPGSANQEAVPKKKKRRIVPVVDASPAPPALSTSGQSNEPFARIGNSAGFLFGGGRQMKQNVVSLFDELNKIAQVPKQQEGEVANEDVVMEPVKPNEEPSIQEDPKGDSGSNLGGLASLLQGSRFS